MQWLIFQGKWTYNGQAPCLPSWDKHRQFKPTSALSPAKYWSQVTQDRQTILLRHFPSHCPQPPELKLLSCGDCATWWTQTPGANSTNVQRWAALGTSPCKVLVVGREEGTMVTASKSSWWRGQTTTHHMQNELQYETKSLEKWHRLWGLSSEEGKVTFWSRVNGRGW